MGEPVGKASGRTFESNGHLRPRALLEFALGDILHSPTICKPTAVRSLEERFTHARLCTYKVNLTYFVNRVILNQVQDPAPFNKEV